MGPVRKPSNITNAYASVFLNFNAIRAVTACTNKVILWNNATMGTRPMEMGAMARAKLKKDTHVLLLRARSLSAPPRSVMMPLVMILLQLRPLFQLESALGY